MQIVCEITAQLLPETSRILGAVTERPVIDALALMAQEGGMGTFDAIRRSLAETAGAGAALRAR